MVPKANVRELDMSVDEALKYIISMGVVAPRPPHGIRAAGATPAPRAAATTATPATPVGADAAAHPRN